MDWLIQLSSQSDEYMRGWPTVVAGCILMAMSLFNFLNSTVLWKLRTLQVQRQMDALPESAPPRLRWILSLNLRLRTTYWRKATAVSSIAVMALGIFTVVKGLTGR
jgi:hypothetical protein